MHSYMQCTVLRLYIHLLMLDSSGSCTGAIASAILFAILFAVSVVVFTTVIVITIKPKTKIRGVDNELAHRTTATVSDYEYVIHQQSPQAAIDTRKNIAYGQSLNTNSSTTAAIQTET